MFLQVTTTTVVEVVHPVDSIVWLVGFFAVLAALWAFFVWRWFGAGPGFTGAVGIFLAGYGIAGAYMPHTPPAAPLAVLTGGILLMVALSLMLVSWLVRVREEE